jgi:hypothetical protein
MRRSSARWLGTACVSWDSRSTKADRGSLAEAEAGRTTQTASIVNVSKARGIAADPRTGIVNAVSSPQSVQWPRRCHVHELPDCIGDPPPDRSTGAVTILSKLRRPYRTFRLSLIAVVLEHQVGDAPNVDLRYQSARLMKSPPGLPMTLGNAAAARVRLIVWCKACRHQVEPDAAEMARQYGAGTSVLDWRDRLVCSRCGSRAIDMVVTGTERR